MHDYWHQHPPVHKLVAGFVGYKPSKIIQKNNQDNQQSNNQNIENVNLDSFLEALTQPII